MSLQLIYQWQLLSAGNIVLRAFETSWIYAESSLLILFPGYMQICHPVSKLLTLI